ncbi:Protein of unknown function DUF788, TMEM208 [Lasallia pustulata]|uniref:DUF788 domain-containing protein n=1 Tax=Lasallia pustulata TaxID=136370 RepID=A0A1W5D856_9LECA|nr:Protein of unknown function DUF788, TMEM208 [Lasallia pustulata]
MAQKAAKQLAARNTAILNRTHAISLALNLLFIILRLLIFRSSRSRPTLHFYTLLSLPALVIEFWLERIGRPTHGANGELQRSGEDLEAKGLTEFMWDVLYWTWGCVVAATVLGNKGWWLWSVIPVYGTWLAYTTFGSVKKGMGGLTGQSGEDGVASGGATSNRQRKMEKRGGQKMQYR